MSHLARFDEFVSTLGPLARGQILYTPTPPPLKGWGACKEGGGYKIPTAEASKFTLPPPLSPGKCLLVKKGGGAGGTMRAEIITHMIYSEGSEYPEYVMHFFLPKVFRDPQISEYVRQILSQSVLLSEQKIA